MKKYPMKKVQPLFDTITLDGCQFEIFDSKMWKMSNCGKEFHFIGRLVFNVCAEHYDYLKSIGKEPRGKVKK
jgi:hypothetical protein